MTVEISSLVAQYIAKNTRLIIPEIGTLLRRKESGEIVFMEMLKKSDGSLVALVAGGLGLSEEEAAKAVEQYVGTIKSQLATNKKFILDGVGVLLAGVNGGVEFIFNPQSHTIDAVEEPKSKTVAEEPQVIELAEEPQVVAAKEPVVAEPAPEVVMAKEPVVAEPAPEVVAVEKKPAQVAPKVIATEEPQKKSAKIDALYGEESEQDKEPKKAFPTPARPRTSAKPQHKKLDPITILAIVSGLIAIGTLIWGMIPTNKPLDIEVPVEIVEE
ncbi:MAG: hypothetical protein IKA28_04030 [Tidjanibacter sp.]|nr:hypothetical protein [Tidjanibacter sp.]